MIYADNQLKEKILNLVVTFENEVIEFKEHGAIILSMILENIFLL